MPYLADEKLLSFWKEVSSRHVLAREAHYTAFDAIPTATTTTVLQRFHNAKPEAAFRADMVSSA